MCMCIQTDKFIFFHVKMNAEIKVIKERKAPN